MSESLANFMKAKGMFDESANTSHKETNSTLNSEATLIDDEVNDNF